MSSREAPNEEPPHAALKVAFLGPEGSFTHAAARRAFDEGADFLPSPSITAVFAALTSGQVDAAVVPIENSTDGGVGSTLDGLLEHEVVIEGEQTLEIEQCLLSLAPSLLAVHRVLSHPQGLGQCRGWLATHLPQAEQVASLSTSAAAREAALDASAAAIGSRLAAELHGLAVLEESIQDIRENITRFIVLGTRPQPRTGHDKTSLAFSTPHEQGALCKVLTAFDNANINLTKIESRPAKHKLWEYIFFVDIEGHLEDPNVARAISELRQRCAVLRVLGSYPRGGN